MFTKGYLTIPDLLTRESETLLIDTRGVEDFEPAIPGSKTIYILKLLDRVKEFEKRYDQVLRNRMLLLYCSNENGSKMVRDKFSRRYEVRYLKGGMVGYLEAVTRLLGEHPYENPQTREETQLKLLQALTNRKTPFKTFRNIATHLIRSNPGFLKS
ncbi:MAG: rhodanese-like domain-containing protein [Magnetococcales bacterium]|nr:rhodanese-like domain-containing protein [Magnetococcales bacterium]